MQLIIVGINGLVGQEFIKLIQQDEYCLKSIVFVGSERSKGTIFKFKNNNYTMITLDEHNWENDGIYINCADGEQAKLINSKMTKDSILIDNSSYFRLNENVPLVVPEINFPKEKNRIYANPNCSTIILNLLMKPLFDKFGIKRVVVSTYQAASGAGKNGLDELLTQTKENLDNLTTNFWGKQYIHNTFVHNTPINMFNGYNEEECKIMSETKKIFNKNIPITSTCIRVPVLRSHCESVNIELEKSTNYEEILNVLNKAYYLEVLDDKEKRIFPESITSNNRMKVQVGHIRKDLSLEDGFGWNFWISGDQLLRGAAGNAYLILKEL